MRRQPQDESWKDMINQQAELNKQIMEEEKILEKAKKDLLIQQYQSHQSYLQRKAADNFQQRTQEQSEMDEKIQLYRDDMQSRVNTQKEMKSYLSNSYKDQMAYKKQIQNDEKKTKLEDEQYNIQRALQSLQQEQDLKFKQRQQAKQEMLEFYNNKKRQETQKLAEKDVQKLEFKQMMEQQAYQQQIKEDNYRKYYQQFNEVQSNAAKNFVPFDNNKDRRIQEMIEKGIQQDRQRQLQEEELRKQNMISRRLDLKTGLQQQLAFKERNIFQKKQEFIQNQDDILSKSLEQRQYVEQQRNQLAQNKMQYKSHLDQQRAESLQITKDSSPAKLGLSSLATEENQRTVTIGNKSPILTTSQSAQSLIHNPLLNPIPNNVQNPYLLKQLGGNLNMNRLTAGRMNYANLASSSIMTPKNNLIL